MASEQELAEWLEAEVQDNEVFRTLFLDISIKHKQLVLNHMMLEHNLACALKKVEELEHQLKMVKRQERDKQRIKRESNPTYLN